MPAALKHVYCFQLGSEDCYKIGRTKNPPEKRMREFSTGSPARFTLYRVERTEHPAALEKHIHGLLCARRAENGEFFYAPRHEVDAAFEDGIAFIAELQPLVAQVMRLKELKPGETLAEATDDVRATYRKLKDARRQRLLLDQKIEFLESKIQVAIGANAGIDGIASWNWVDNWQLDVTAFREKEPDQYEALFERYKRNSGTRHFSLAKGDLTRANAPPNEPLTGRASAAE